jgi:hypothetical protein
VPSAIFSLSAFKACFYAVLNTFKRCNPEKRERVQPIRKTYKTWDEFDVNAVLNRLCAGTAYGRIRAANRNTEHHHVPMME